MKFDRFFVARFGSTVICLSVARFILGEFNLPISIIMCGLALIWGVASRLEAQDEDRRRPLQ